MIIRYFAILLPRIKLNCNFITIAQKTHFLSNDIYALFVRRFIQCLTYPFFYVCALPSYTYQSYIFCKSFGACFR